MNVGICALLISLEGIIHHFSGRSKLKALVDSILWGRYRPYLRTVLLVFGLSAVQQDLQTSITRISRGLDKVRMGLRCYSFNRCGNGGIGETDSDCVIHPQREGVLVYGG